MLMAECNLGMSLSEVLYNHEWWEIFLLCDGLKSYNKMKHGEPDKKEGEVKEKVLPNGRVEKVNVIQSFKRNKNHVVSDAAKKKIEEAYGDTGR